MWIAGTLILFAAGVTAIVIIGGTPRATPSPPLWDIPGLGGIYTGIVGTLAGFSVASAIFIAGLDVGRQSPVFATVIGMLLVSFLNLVMTALMYALIPSAPEDGDDAAVQSLALVLANMSGCMGLAISWLTLAPLLELIGLPSLADAFTWLLLIVAIAGSGSVALFAYRMTTANVAACLVIPVLGFALAAFYRLGAVRLWPALWPATDAALQFAFVAFGVVVLMFGFQSGLLLAHGEPAMRVRVRRDGHRVALAYSVVSVVTVGLTWFAVAMP
jgi:hypothetical protein